ncbi:hypothetical protein [Salinibaculum salinum]|uniref:hypothetical protein n=1 Tax=Salinibaculum salinum TaxID=3131996 RepID=UPI0030EC1F61
MSGPLLHVWRVFNDKLVCWTEHQREQLDGSDEDNRDPEPENEQPGDTSESGLVHYNPVIDEL